MVAAVLAFAAIAAPSLPEVDVRVPRRIGGNDVPGEMRMPGYEGRISIDVRGGWSRNFPKRSYNVELQDPDGDNRNEPCSACRRTMIGSCTPRTTTAR